MAIIIETRDPGVRGVRKTVKRYVKMNPELSGPIEVYGAVMEVQQDALSRVDCKVDLGDDDIENSLREGKPLIDPREVKIDAGLFSDVLAGICNAMVESGANSVPDFDLLLEWEGLEQGNLGGTVRRALEGNRLEEDGRWDEIDDRGIFSNVVWESLAPFMRKYGSILQSKIDNALWRRGYCPVCGGRPLMGEFRKGDGLWLIECSLCHTMWNVQRARCPFCEEGVEGSLGYLYLDEERSYRIQYCETCKRYVKTIDLRDSDEEVLLPIEDMLTARLDSAAMREGLKPAEGYAFDM